MTHDELLAKINEMEKIAVYAYLSSAMPHITNASECDERHFNALRAVVELHKPKHFIGNDEIYCACSLSPLIAYPCPTIQAIEKELG